MTVRLPAAAGRFYESSAQELRKQIRDMLPALPVEKTTAIACMLPHAGYTYSGRVAVETVCAIRIPERVILLGPNHTGLGQAFSLMTGGAWQTPLGRVDIDTALAKKILAGSRYLKDDSLAHQDEHSLEVELPILQYFKSDLAIVPLVFMTDNTASLKQTGKEIAAAVEGAGLKGSVLIVASSDMTHYEPQEAALAKDKQAIEAILRLDEDLLAERVSSLDISMCGIAPAIVMITAAKALGAKSGELVRYQTSGDVTGDRTSVVGYAGIRIS